MVDIWGGYRDRAMTQAWDRKTTVCMMSVAKGVTAIAFNKESEQVESVHSYTLRDGKVIAYNDRETPTRGREMTILEQMLGAVGHGGVLPNNQDEGVPGTRPGDRRN